MSQSTDKAGDSTQASPSPFAEPITQDLAARPRKPPPDDAEDVAREERLRTRGLWMIITGAVAVVLTMTTALVWRAGFGEPMPYEIVIPIYGLGLLAAALGCTERLNRTTRRNVELARAEVDVAHKHVMSELARLENGLYLLVDLMPEALAQQFYAGFGNGVRSVRQTGTDSSRAVGTADVVRFERRQNRPPG